jgi:asparagine synthase (glutamine-hydrolysing)
MCGIVGFVDFHCNSSVVLLEAMTESLRYRGPDHQDSYFLDQGNFVIGLGHARLAILDISASGNQPMHYQHWSIVLNGEVYNFREIKEDLVNLGHHFASESDTEVVLKAFASWGKECVHRFIGMFAFAIYDHNKRELYLCRDRVGVKPLYYFFDRDILIFGSELKPLMKHPSFRPEINQNSMQLFFQYGYIPGPQTIFESTSKLDPGTWLTYSIDKRNISFERYWDVTDHFSMPTRSIKFETAVEEVHNLLISACKYRMVADVPVGLFLSGGYDSSMVTAILQKDPPRALKTFTIGFPDGMDESVHARKIASHLGTEHTSYDCSKEDAISIIPTLPFYFDEPSSDISAIPTILAAKLAKEQVTVAISADGGDEIFAGYNGYLTIPRRFEKLKQIPFQSAMAKVFAPLNDLEFLSDDLRHKLNGVSRVLKESPQNQMARLIDRSSIIPDFIIQDLCSNKELALNPVFQKDYSSLTDTRSTMFVTDVKGALQDMLLVKVDRATMSVSLEGREPLLDHRLIEYVATLPFCYKHDGQISKKILREIAHKYIPSELLNRPKTGFDLPIYKWLKNELAYMLDDLIDDNKFFSESKINKNSVKKLVTKFRNEQLKYIDIIWRLVMFRLWWNYWLSDKTPV